MSHGFLEWLHHSLYFFVRGRTYENQYVGTVHMDEHTLEHVLMDYGLHYNYLAYWKRLRHKDSVGSWKMDHGSHPEYVEPGMQLHLTLYPNDQDPHYIDVYCHYERNWADDPLGHLKEHDFNAAEGVRRCRDFLLTETDVRLYDKRIGD